jgi:hypothetical protein
MGKSAKPVVMMVTKMEMKTMLIVEEYFASRVHVHYLPIA